MFCRTKFCVARLVRGTSLPQLQRFYCTKSIIDQFIEEPVRIVKKPEKENEEDLTAMDVLQRQTLIEKQIMYEHGKKVAKAGNSKKYLKNFLDFFLIFFQFSSSSCRYKKVVQNRYCGRI